MASTSGNGATPERGADGPPLRVLIADDDALSRMSLRAVLEDGGMIVVGEATCGEEAVTLAVRHRPDVVVMDLVMPDVDGIAATRRLTQAAPEVRVVVVTLSPDAELGLVALHAGADGFVSKDGDIDELPKHVRDVVAGVPALSADLRLRLVRRLRELPVAGTGLRPVFSPLSRREWEVIDRLSVGHSADKIADDFVLSPETVRTHIKNILRKLGVHSQADAIAEVARIRGDPGAEFEASGGS